MHVYAVGSDIQHFSNYKIFFIRLPIKCILRVCYFGSHAICKVTSNVSYQINVVGAKSTIFKMWGDGNIKWQKVEILDFYIIY